MAAEVRYHMNAKNESVRPAALEGEEESMRLYLRRRIRHLIENQDFKIA